MDIIEDFTPKSRIQWRKWLEDNHLKSKNIYLVYHKKARGIPSLSWREAVEEALCFGWIDSVKHKVDDKRYKQKFTPRKANSNWSKINKELATKLEREGLMTESGRKKIEEAKINGKWFEN